MYKLLSSAEPWSWQHRLAKRDTKSTNECSFSIPLTHSLKFLLLLGSAECLRQGKDEGPRLEKLLQPRRASRDGELHGQGTEEAEKLMDLRNS